MDFMTRMVRKKVVEQIRNDLMNTYKENRIQFKDNDSICYKSRKGEITEDTVVSISTMLWGMFNDKLMSLSGIAQANLAVIEITPEDIAKILISFKENKK